MPWLAETNFEIDASFGQYGDFMPWVHLIDQTSFLMIFSYDSGDGLKLLAWPGDIASDGTATLHDSSEVIEVSDMASNAYIMGVQALPDGGYQVILGRFASG